MHDITLNGRIVRFGEYQKRGTDQRACDESGRNLELKFRHACPGERVSGGDGGRRGETATGRKTMASGVVLMASAIESAVGSPSVAKS